MGPSDAERRFIDAFSQALRDAAPETNRSGWYSKMADETGLGEEAIKKWVYGQNAPNIHSFLVVLDYLGADFGNKIFALIGYKIVPIGSAETDNTRLSELLSETNAALRRVSEEISKQLPGGRTDATPKKSKAVA